MASQKAAEEASAILQLVAYNSQEVAKICQIIVEHSFSLCLNPSSIESAILQDAGRLDALGAIGLMRMVTCGARLGSRLRDLKQFCQLLLPWFWGRWASFLPFALSKHYVTWR